MAKYAILLIALLTQVTLSAQLPQLEISGFIKSDSLAGSGVRNVVADADGLLKIDSNTVTSSLIELRDSTGDLKFRLDADQCLFQMLSKGEVVRFFQYTDTIIVDSAQIAQNRGAFSNNPAFIINDARNKLLSIKAKVELAFPGFILQVPPPFDTTADVCTDGFVGGANYDWTNSMGSYRSNITDEAVYRFIIFESEDGSKVFRVHFDSESPSNEMITIELLDADTGKEITKDLNTLCASQQEQTIDRSGGDDTKTKWKNGDGSKSTTVTGGSIETSDFSGTPKSAIISPNNMAVVKGTDIVIMAPDKVNFIGNSGSVTMSVNTSTNKVDLGSADLCANSVTQTSDKRLKSNIKSMSTSLPQIMKLQPRSYNYNYTGADRRLYTGLVAQDVQKVFPHLVSLNESPHPDISDKPYLTMDYIGLVPILTKGIQEMAEKDQLHDLLLQELHAKIETQEALIHKLTRLVEQLEKE